MRQIFDAGIVQRIQITNLDGKLKIHGWDQPTIEVNSSDEINQLQPRANLLIIDGCDEDLTIMVPYATIIGAADIKKSVAIEHVQQVEIHDVHDDLRLKDIEQATLGSVGKDLVAQDINTLQCDNVGDDCQVLGLRESVIVLGHVGKDLSVRAVGRLTAEYVGHDCRVTDSEQAEIAIRSVGKDLVISGAHQVSVEHVGSDANIRAVQESVRIEAVGNDLALTDIGGDISFKAVGSDAILKSIHGLVAAGNIGADVHLQADFVPDSVSRLKIGGDASIILPPEPNLTIQAFVGGDISGRAIVSSQIGNRATLTYGEGSARLELIVGGDLVLRSDKGPKDSSNSNVWWDDFGREMADFGREMGNMGRDLATELSAAFTDAAASIHVNIDPRAARNMQNEKARERAEKLHQKASERAEKLHQKARERAQHAQEKHHDLNKREWRTDPERINRLVEEAQRAASDGVLGAMEAVEQALRNINPNRPPTAPVPPMPFGPTGPGGPSGTEASDIYAAQPVDERSQPEVPADIQAAPIDIEQEREAILRMIAEGRISPEEGDMLLEALGS